MKKLLYPILLLFILSGCSEYYNDESIRKGKDGAYELSNGKSGSSDGSGQDIEPGQITAGEWNDLTNWTYWNNLFQKKEYNTMPEYWAFDISKRVSVELRNQAGRLAVNCPITLLNEAQEVLWKSKTDNFGRAELWASLETTSGVSTENLLISINKQTFNNIVTFDKGVNKLTVQDNQTNKQKRANIAFMVDATGSMGDELEYLKSELIDIIGRVKEQQTDASIFTGTVFYRDIGDEYVTKKSDFTTDIATTANFIKNQKANGGGDFPEAVHTAMKATIQDLQWADNSETKLMFMILDAPPHYETQIISEIHKQVTIASQKGIKLIPVTASGIDKKTEFLMRYMAIATNGTYVFITNHSGIGNSHLEPTIGEYKVEYLNNLLVRLINKYMED